jgi:hypothetical protein
MHIIAEKKDRRILRLFMVTLSLLNFVDLQAQTTVPVSPGQWTEQNCKAAFQGGVIHLTNTSGKTAMLWLEKANFKNGTIELDIKGKDVDGESFVGVAFHARDNETYDAIYFRPFAFDMPEKKDHSVQYISLPGFDWDILREKHMGKYERSIIPEVNGNDWFHVKIVVLHPSVKVFVNGSRQPTMEIEQLNNGKYHGLALWMDSQDGQFKNVTVTSDNKK